ncbi:hypothetical protein C8F01DRAFT_1091624 [Mycena amicta]|nr:hypothetical protein C8F01DRAFT_1091624 [Mycena amicta]
MDPRLPREMEQEIFETAGEIHPADIPSLLHVARRTHYWLEPLLYRHVHIELPDPEDYEYWQAFFHAASTKPPSFLARGVRSVVWRHSNTEDSEFVARVYSCLKLCTGVIRISINGDDEPCALLLLPILASMNLRWMTVLLDTILPAPDSLSARSPPFAAITHFDLSDFILLDAGAEQRLLQFLIALPALTHLAVRLVLRDPTPDDRAVKYILDGCRGLEVLVLLMAHSQMWHPGGADDIRIWAEMLPVRDRRIVITTYTVSWEGICPELMNYWRAADIFLEQKRLGAVPGSQKRVYKQPGVAGRPQGTQTSHPDARQGAIGAVTWCIRSLQTSNLSQKSKNWCL